MVCDRTLEIRERLVINKLPNLPENSNIKPRARTLELSLLVRTCTFCFFVLGRVWCGRFSRLSGPLIQRREFGKS